MLRLTRLTLAVAGLASILAGSARFTQAGAVGGPKENLNERVEARATDIYHVRFYGGELAEVLVTGDGDTDLDLFVYDEFGNLIASDTDLTDVCLAQWVPRWTGTFRIEVKNHGGVYNRYHIITN